MRFTNHFTNIWDFTGLFVDLIWVYFLVHACRFDFSSVKARFAWPVLWFEHDSASTTV